MHKWYREQENFGSQISRRLFFRNQRRELKGLLFVFVFSFLGRLRCLSSFFNSQLLHQSRKETYCVVFNSQSWLRTRNVELLVMDIVGPVSGTMSNPFSRKCLIYKRIGKLLPKMNWKRKKRKLYSIIELHKKYECLQIIIVTQGSGSWLAFLNGSELK